MPSHETASVTIHVNVEECMPKAHVDHADGRFSLRLSTLVSVNALYLTGTAAEHREFAAKLLDAVTAHERQALIDAAN